MGSLSVIVASGGRLTLAQTLASVTPQLTVHDQLLCLVDQRAPFGHASRNLMMGWATGDWLCFLDDDEEWLPGAADVIRGAVSRAPAAAHLFEVSGDQGMHVVVPRSPWLARWDESAGAEGLEQFVARTARRVALLNHPEVLVRHGG